MWSQHQRYAVVVGIYVLLWLTLWYSARIADVLGGASLWFLPAGLRFCAFLLFGWPALLLELLTVFIANLSQFAASGQPAPGMFTPQAGWLVYDWLALPFAYALVLFPLRGHRAGWLDLAMPGHSARFIGAAIAAAILGALVGTVRLVYAGFIDQQHWTNAVASWFVGDFIGILTLAPLLLVRGWPRLARHFEGRRSDGLTMAAPVTPRHRADLMTLLATTCSVFLVFGVPRYLGLSVQFPLVALLLLLPLVGVALQYGLRGAVLAVVLLDGGLVVSVALLQQQQLTLQYQMVMIAIALVGLWLGGAVESRNQLLESYNKELLAEVAQQTLDLLQANRELTVKEQHLQVVLTAAPVGVLEFDESGCCTYVNGIGRTLTECLPEQAMGRHLLDFVHPLDRETVNLVWNSQRDRNTVQTLELRLTNNLWCTAHWVHLPQSDSSHHAAILVLTDSTVRRQQEDRLWTLGHHDSLTSLPNRKLFMDRCEQALSLARRRDNGAAMLWIDLDKFKMVNDTLGHAAGDALLQQVAQRLKCRIRDSDTLARIGGDEFAVIMPEVKSGDAAVQVANELLASLSEPFHLPQGSAQISGSIGIALYPQHVHTIEAMMRCADLAMYNAKHAGSNQVHVGLNNGHEAHSSRMLSEPA